MQDGSIELITMAVEILWLIRRAAPTRVALCGKNYGSKGIKMTVVRTAA
jgi:hypothetical protein